MNFLLEDDEDEELFNKDRRGIIGIAFLEMGGGGGGFVGVGGGGGGFTLIFFGLDCCDGATVLDDDILLRGG